MMQWLLPPGGWLMVGQWLRAVFLLPARFTIRSETVEVSTKSIGRRQTIRARFILSQEWIDVEQLMKAITLDIDRTGSYGAHVAVRIGEQHRSRACGIPVLVGVDLSHGHRSKHVGHDRRQTVRGHLAVERRDEDRA